MATGPLTEREQQALEQAREALEQGSTLKDYAAKIGLDVRAALSSGFDAPSGRPCLKMTIFIFALGETG